MGPIETCHQHHDDYSVGWCIGKQGTWTKASRGSGLSLVTTTPALAATQCLPSRSPLPSTVFLSLAQLYFSNHLNCIFLIISSVFLSIYNNTNCIQLVHLINLILKHVSADASLSKQADSPRAGQVDPS